MNAADTTLFNFLTQTLMGNGSVHPATRHELESLKMPKRYVSDPMKETLIVEMNATTGINALAHYVGVFHTSAGCRVEFFTAEGLPLTKIVKYTFPELAAEATIVCQLDPAGSRFYIR